MGTVVDPFTGEVRSGATTAGDVAKAGGALAPLGQIATRCQTPETVASGKQLMAKKYHQTKPQVRRFKFVYSAFSVSTWESPCGANELVRAAVQVDGVTTRVRFGGSDTGVIPDGGHLVSDWIDVPLAANQSFFSLTWKDCTAGFGVAYNNGKRCEALGDRFILGTTATDYTDGTTFASTDSNAIQSYGPSAIIAETDIASVIIIGDSRSFGDNSSTGSSADFPDAETFGHVGAFERAIGPTLPYINVARSGDRMDYFRTGGTKRIELAQYCSVAIYATGINDISNDRSATQIEADRNSVLTQLPQNMPVYISTINPRTNSSDNWATNQTYPSTTRETRRLNENTARRAVPAGFAACIDITSVVEVGGQWIMDGSAFYATSDGTHETKVANQLIAASGVVPVAQFALVKNAKQVKDKARGQQVASYWSRNSGFNLLADKSGMTVSNAGASALTTYTLPDAYRGLEFTVVNDTSFGAKITARAGATINVGGTVTGDAGSVQSTTVGHSITLIAISNSKWVAKSFTGAWPSV